VTGAEATVQARRWIATYGRTDQVGDMLAALLADNAALHADADRAESLALEATRQTYLRDVA
jgi:hypothetical protein